MSYLLKNNFHRWLDQLKIRLTQSLPSWAGFWAELRKKQCPLHMENSVVKCLQSHQGIENDILLSDIWPTEWVHTNIVNALANIVVSIGGWPLPTWKPGSPIPIIYHILLALFVWISFVSLNHNNLGAKIEYYEWQVWACGHREQIRSQALVPPQLYDMNQYHIYCQLFCP